MTKKLPSDVETQSDPLVGRGFHMLDEHGCAHWQGQVIAALGDGYYLVQLFDQSQQIVMHIKDMATTPGKTWGGCVFYSDVAEAREYYERVLAPRQNARNREKEPRPPAAR